MERDNRIRIRALLDSGASPTEIAKQLGVSRKTVYNVKGREDVERRPGNGRKPSIDIEVIKTAIEAEPTKSLRNHARDMGVSHTALNKAVKKMGGKSLVRVERPLLTPAIKLTHLQRCQGLLNNLKSARAGRVVIFSDEKTWTVDPVRNRQNDRYISFGEIDETLRTLTTTKHAASVMSLGFVASNGIKMPLIWFPKGYRLNGSDYVQILREKLVP
jgi:transposase-like protein